MEYVTLGRSNVKVTRLTFGAWAIGGWMWGGADRKDALKAIHKSLDLGITSIDTAPAYGFGLSEKIVGEAVRGVRKDVQILTKYGLIWDKKIGKFYFNTTDNDSKPVSIYKYADKESVINECEQSLKRLKTDYIDLLQIHWPDPTTPILETMEAMEVLLKAGKIRAAGVCNYDLEEMKTAAGVWNHEHEDRANADRVWNYNQEDMTTAGESYCLASNQVPYSMLKRDIEKDIVPWCIDNNVSILAYSPLQRGLLTGKIKSGHKFNEGDSRPATPYYRDSNINKTNEFLEKLKPVAADKNATLSQLVLRWTMQMPGITVVLSGARNPEQIEENAGALNLKLDEDEMKLINSLLDNVKLDPGK
jgi:aryl-alcohol dehydrogenase-like predicted oxidoreductase